MKPHRRRRLSIVLFLFVGALTTVLITIFALQNYINHFYLPDQIISGDVPVERTIRAGGKVKEGSIAHDSTGLGVTFDITDGVSATFSVRYEGIFPSLFREGEYTIVVGKLDTDGVFTATQILAKHDENYVPPELKGIVEHDDS